MNRDHPPRQPGGGVKPAPGSACSAKGPGNGGRRARDRRAYLVQGLSYALDILEAFGPGHEELGLSDIAARLGLSPEVAVRHLKTLERRAYLRHDTERGTYSLGLKTFEVGSIFLHHLHLDREASPFLSDLAAASDETAYLAVMDGAGVSYLQTRETHRMVRVQLPIGRRIPLHSSAAGKVHLAFRPLDRVADMADHGRLLSFTSKTMTDPSALEEDLHASAERGYAIDDEETVAGVRCVAAPIFDHSNEIVAGIGITSPADRLPAERIEQELAWLIKDVSAELSKRLGYRR
jgi:IclR family KDG regulon transcriptional repressor